MYEPNEDIPKTELEQLSVRFFYQDQIDGICPDFTRLTPFEQDRFLRSVALKNLGAGLIELLIILLVVMLFGWVFYGDPLWAYVVFSKDWSVAAGVDRSVYDLTFLQTLELAFVMGFARYGVLLLCVIYCPSYLFLQQIQLRMNPFLLTWCWILLTGIGILVARPF